MLAPVVVVVVVAVVVIVVAEVSIVYPLQFDVHVVRLETTKPVPIESLCFPLCLQPVAVAVAVYTLLPEGMYLARVQVTGFNFLYQMS